MKVIYIALVLYSLYQINKQGTELNFENTLYGAIFWGGLAFLYLCAKRIKITDEYVQCNPLIKVYYDKILSVHKGLWREQDILVKLKGFPYGAEICLSAVKHDEMIAYLKSKLKSDNPLKIYLDNPNILNNKHSEIEKVKNQRKSLLYIFIFFITTTTVIWLGDSLQESLNRIINGFYDK